MDDPDALSAAQRSSLRDLTFNNAVNTQLAELANALSSGPVSAEKARAILGRAWVLGWLQGLWVNGVSSGMLPSHKLFNDDQELFSKALISWRDNPDWPESSHSP